VEEEKRKREEDKKRDPGKRAVGAPSRSSSVKTEADSLSHDGREAGRREAAGEPVSFNRHLKILKPLLLEK